MSTSETVDLEIAACPCGAGKIIKYITTQDNPWSSADISYGIGCRKCAGEWRIATYGGMINIESERPYREAYATENALSAQIHEIVDPLVNAHFTRLALRAMTAELREMHRLGIARINIDQYRKERRRGRSYADLTHALNNLEWLSRLVSEAGKGEGFAELRSAYEDAKRRSTATQSQIIRRSIDR
jgi:hypothetical protein